MARAAGYPRVGGKVDDISVVVARVVAAEDESYHKGSYYAELIEEGIADPAKGSINPEDHF